MTAFILRRSGIDIAYNSSLSADVFALRALVLLRPREFVFESDCDAEDFEVA